MDAGWRPGRSDYHPASRSGIGRSCRTTCSTRGSAGGRARARFVWPARAKRRGLPRPADVIAQHWSSTPEGPAPFRFSSGALANGDALLVACCPSGRPLKTDDGGAVRNSRASPLDYFVPDLDTFRGNSGSGVYLQSTGDSPASSCAATTTTFGSAPATTLTSVWTTVVGVGFDLRLHHHR